MSQRLRQTWDLETIFPGGSSSEEFDAFLKKLAGDVDALAAKIGGMQPPSSADETAAFDSVFDDVQGISSRFRQAGAFVSCLGAQDQNDQKAGQLAARVGSVRARWQSVLATFDSLLQNTEDGVWEAWMSREVVSPVSFNLSESRLQAREKMSPELESLALSLSVDGYQGWSSFYNTIVRHVRVKFTENGETKLLSAAQAANKLGSADPKQREEMGRNWEQAWADVEDYCSDTLNHLAGFRLALYEKRGWENVLREPLEINRMSDQTLETMWRVITDNKPVFVEYLNRKAKLLGTDKLGWHDVDAPVGESADKIPYDDAAELIVEQFRSFSPRMADFARGAFDQHWIEAEDRAGKRPGGFCTALPLTKQTRIFMTYSGTASNVSTLAHELGHGYHQHVMDELPTFSQRYAMNVAETASTFAEMIVADSLVRKASSEEERLVLLEDKIQRSIAFFMNIHARFLFETRFYEKRREGLLTPQDLSDLMVEAQQEAFCGALSDYHPHFWASKLHFYNTGVPFYNFPYTFGYMFSTGIYARAQQEGAAFANKYDALLLDTGRMRVEDLAQKHLGVDLTQPDFWQAAIDVSIADVHTFLEMTKDRV
ncbi:M3 family oligoendopeptidase [Saccharibacillus sp. CPCC 101409]|uniref:M3 family oligoendopeptidase n=1 Tax=Saccharibacillus sp. CPCC 101409 TaxID=3058041 RepID=UPI002672D223|nr:M3 family oligoendopeptidase [Saccharibacillus sp. CPCC 101409]MDO3410989.1 M3 family oligoendopeptidase [Saccharibacillus sp. CPCC 101409]